MESIILIGHDDVLRAGHVMAGAATEMQRAANQIDTTRELQQRFLEEFIVRFETAVEKMNGGQG